MVCLFYYSEGDGYGKISFEAQNLKIVQSKKQKELIADLDHAFDTSFMAKMKNEIIR